MGMGMGMGEGSMMTYRDMTFCRFHDDCAAGTDCARQLTQAVMDDAKRLGLLISQFVERPECFEECGTETEAAA